MEEFRERESPESEQLRLQECVTAFSKNIRSVGILNQRTCRSRMRFNPEGIQRVVSRTVQDTRACVVNVNWNGDEWNVNTWDRDDNDWNEGDRVFSPETTEFLPLEREFSLQVRASIRLPLFPLSLDLQIALHIFYYRG